MNDVKDVYESAAALLYKVLDGINENELNWKPAPESRSINEMFGHLVRVDNSFLEKLGSGIKAQDPSGKPVEEILLQLRIQHSEFARIINLIQERTANGYQPDKEMQKLILHAAQHYLYHLSQMIYLRRALDRQWESPIEDWEKLTYKIAEKVLL